MDVNELFRRLSHGPFSNISIGNNGNGTILEARRDALVGFANNALLNLYSRFILREEDLALEQHADISYYKLSYDYAQTNPDPAGVQYIKDTVSEPFQDDVIRILAIYDETGEALPLNDPDDLKSLFTPQPTVIQVPQPVDLAPLGVVYQAQHPKLPYGTYTTKITLPTTLEQALVANVAAQQFSGMGGQEHMLKAQEQMTYYEAICTQVEAKDLVSNTHSQSGTRFELRGFI